MKVYTKTGDKGETGNLAGQRVSKASEQIEALGAVDELNSHIGLIVSFTHDEEVKEVLTRIQRLLFVAGSEIAVGDRTLKTKRIPKISKSNVIFLEGKIDQMDKELSELKGFILPQGTPLTSLIHVARVVARRAERRVSALNELSKLNLNLLSFLNRLSDYLFTLARYTNKKENIEDILWK